MIEKVAAMEEPTSESTRIVGRYYENYYSRVHTRGFLGRLHRITHFLLERRRTSNFPLTLELGAGSFEHFPSVKHSWNRYIATDIREPQPNAETEMILTLPGFEFTIADAMRLPFPRDFADRIVAGCLIVHLNDPREAVIEWQRVTKKSGVIDFLVPCEPGLLVRFLRLFISEPRAKRMGVSKETLRTVHALEHVSSFHRTLRLVRSGVEEGRVLKVSYYPLPFFPSWNLNVGARFSIEPTTTKGSY